MISLFRFSKSDLVSAGPRLNLFAYASQLVIRGISLYIVQKLLGHKHIETTMRYAHLSPEVKDEAVQNQYSNLRLVQEDEESQDGKAD